jgi:DNA-binding XRE family transcriptional regulator
MSSPAQSAQPEAVAYQVPQWTFADKIRKVRRDVLGIEQDEFARRLDVTRQAYAAWESGRNEPRNILAVAKRVEAMSGVPAAWLLGIDDPFRTIAPQTSRTGDAGRVTHVQSTDVAAAVIPFPQRSHAAAPVPPMARNRPGDLAEAA